MADTRTVRSAIPILAGAAIMLTVSMGIRQSLGLFMQPLTRDIGLTISDFTLAIAIQNLFWGFLQPVSGGLVVRFGFRPILVGGALLYLVGLAVLAGSRGVGGGGVGGGAAVGRGAGCPAAARGV